MKVMKEVRFCGIWGLVFLLCAITSPLYAIEVHVENSGGNGIWVVDPTMGGGLQMRPRKPRR